MLTVEPFTFPVLRGQDAPPRGYWLAKAGEVEVISDCPLCAFWWACERSLQGAKGREWFLA